MLGLLPLQNLALGCNRLDLAEAFDWPGVRLGLGWNAGAPPPPLHGLLTDRFATADHLFDPACRSGTRSEVRLGAAAAHKAWDGGLQPRALKDASPCPCAQAATPCISMYLQVLLVAFSAQGPGMQQWQAAAVAPCARAARTPLVGACVHPSGGGRGGGEGGGWRAPTFGARACSGRLRALGASIDALYLADPSNSYYLQAAPTQHMHMSHVTCACARACGSSSRLRQALQ